MRNIFLRLRERGTVVIMLLLLSVVVASCGKDDNIIIGANMMNVNGTEMIMGEATFVEYGPMGSGINCDVAICSENMFYDVYNSQVNGNGIFVYSYYADTRFSGIKVAATGGRVKVSSSGNNYSLQFECEYENGAKISGHYQGYPSYYQRQ